MLGEWVLLMLCAFPVRADIGTTAPPPPPPPPPTTTPDVNVKWLESFRRALLRDSYDYGPAPAPAPAAPAAGAPTSTDSSAKSRQDAPAVPSRSTSSVESRQNAPVIPSRTTSSVKSRRDAPAIPNSTTSSSKSRQNINSEDAVASRELGISRRDLRGPKPGDSELDGPNSPRRAFLDSLYELEDQLKPVYVQSNKPSSIDNPLKESRKRWNQQNTEGEIPLYIEENGIKRYLVHTNPKERHRNKLASQGNPRLGEEWGIGNPQEETHVGASEGYRQYTRNNERIEDRYRYVDRIPYSQGRYESKRNDRLARNEGENRFIKYGDVLDGTQFKSKSVQGIHIEQHQDDTSSSDESASSETQERDVSKNKQEIRSRYVAEWRRNAGGGYGERFAARRDRGRELLADGTGTRTASSSTPCSCHSEHPRF